MKLVTQVLEFKALLAADNSKNQKLSKLQWVQSNSSLQEECTKISTIVWERAPQSEEDIAMAIARCMYEFNNLACDLNIHHSLQECLDKIHTEKTV